MIPPPRSSASPNEGFLGASARPAAASRAASATIVRIAAACKSWSSSRAYAAKGSVGIFTDDGSTCASRNASSAAVSREEEVSAPPGRMSTGQDASAPHVLPMETTTRLACGDASINLPSSPCAMASGYAGPSEPSNAPSPLSSSTALAAYFASAPGQSHRLRITAVSSSVYALQSWPSEAEPEMDDPPQPEDPLPLPFPFFSAGSAPGCVHPRYPYCALALGNAGVSIWSTNQPSTKETTSPRSVSHSPRLATSCPSLAAARQVTICPPAAARRVAAVGVASGGAPESSPFSFFAADDASVSSSPIRTLRSKRSGAPSGSPSRSRAHRVASTPVSFSTRFGTTRSRTRLCKASERSKEAPGTASAPGDAAGAPVTRASRCRVVTFDHASGAHSTS